MKQRVEQAATEVAQTAKEVFANGFYDGETPLPDLRSEMPLRLMYALRNGGIQRWQVEALVLALRDVGDAAALKTEDELDAAHKKVLQGIADEEDLPVVFRALLQTVTPLLLKQRDLVAFYGVMNNVIGKWDVMAQTLHMDPNAV